MNLNEIKKELNAKNQARKLTKKMISDEFNGLLKDNGFIKYESNVYIKVSADIIQNITFELPPVGFTCAIAMQPLYIKDHAETTFLHLTFGNRLSRFKIIQKEWWSYDDPIRGITEIRELLNINGFPWFRQYGTPDGIIDFMTKEKLQEYGFIAFREFHQKKYLGFSLLYTGHIDEGIQSLQDMLNEITENAVEWMKEYKRQIIELIDRIIENPSDIKRIMENIIQENRIALKILKR